MKKVKRKEKENLKFNNEDRERGIKENRDKSDTEKKKLSDRMGRHKRKRERK